MKRTDGIILCSFMCLGGIYLGRYVDVAPVLFIVGLLFIFASSKRSIFMGIGLAILVCGLGNVRGTFQSRGFDSLEELFQTKATITGVSLEDAEYDSRGQLAFAMNRIVIDGQEVPGQIAVSGFGEFSVLRGDTVEVTGKVFPARGSNQARVSFAQLDVIQKDDHWYNALRRKLNKKLRDMLPEPQSSFASGLLIGQRTTIPDDIITALRITGLAHIIAVSGYNLTIIVRFVMRVLKRLTRYQKLAISLSVIGLFLAITGFSASIVRAAIVCGLSLLAWYFGRTFRPAVLLGVTAALTALYRPEYVWGDAGWYLSFLAFTGVLIAGPIIKNRLYPDREPKFLGRVSIETIAVLLMVTPYSMYLFGTLSLIALPSNILVVPLVPIAMAFSALILFVPPSLAILAVPARFVLSMILEVTRALSTVPNASLSIKITITEMFVFYMMLSIILFMMWKKSRMRLNGNFLV